MIFDSGIGGVCESVLGALQRQTQRTENQGGLGVLSDSGILHGTALAFGVPWRA